ncbi:MAG: PQQ-like beta-propeller repeat protein [Phycisphaerales bacterium]|nr:PQQ-like beta-propeller repeat protein [Phycisphaerales bacterium]
MPKTTKRTLALAAACLAVVLPATTMAQDGDTLAERRAELDRRYAVGPSAAGELNCRIAWQATIDARGGQLLGIHVENNDVFVIAPGNRMSRLDRSEGKLVWTSTVADYKDKIWGITTGRVHASLSSNAGATKDPGKIYVTTDPVVMEVDYATGGIVGRQDLERIPSTKALTFNQYLVFGTHSGQIVWHQYEVGHAWRANQLKGPILGAPIRVGEHGIAAASMGGTLVVVEGKTARRFWADQLFDGVPAQLATSGKMLFAASRDQYLWAFDANTGQTRWRYFTESPLETSPTAVDDMVLQWVPSEGMVCLEADPGNSVQGIVRWTLKDLKGIVLGKLHGQIVVFDPSSRTLHLVDGAQGAVTKTVPLPQVRNIEMNDGQIYVTGDGGRVQRLDPIG